MLISKGIQLLELDFEGVMIHPVLIWDEETAVLIDSGFPGQYDDLCLALEKIGVPISQLKAVILTHQDVDHIGCLPEILQECGTGVRIYAHELDKPYIEGHLPLLKDDHLEHPPKGKIDETVTDGQELPFCGGIRVIHTPGHTPGHISLYLMRSKTLIAGDSMYSVNGQLGGIHVPTTLDVEAARFSLKKYLELDISSVICYHGGLSDMHIKEQISRLI
ncbi:MBL fold metallo-hydrolase [Paenibacillus sp. 2TAF8]|jgi:glyoxylase-like metal-dependent hydrolase (beta-lactamase superfamily II)|uniref:MBL fold metallo-hydrolase n=1 Tax=Paenibacillus sp. 2TAF8 TaxID=3233020 RepID=UPI003F987D2D